MKTRIIFITILAVMMLSCIAKKSMLEVKVSNTLDMERVDEMVVLKVSDLLKMDPNFNPQNLTIYDSEKELSYQLEENGEQEIVFPANFAPKENKLIKLEYAEGKVNKSFPKRTYAELAMKEGNVFYDKKFHGDHFVNVTDIKVPDIHTDHDALFKYEGPGWESELVGYRFYIDWRNATDIFGKTTKGLVLQNVGINDTVATDDSYHHMQSWGMDIFKVGNTLGIGSPGMMNDSKVFRVEERDSVFCKIKDGPVKSSVETKYCGWKVGDKKYDLTSLLSINAGSRLTKNELTVTNNAENLATGLAKYEGCSFIASNNGQGWNYISLYGKQTLADDNAGVAVLYRSKELKELTEDEINHIVVLTPNNGKVTYYFCAAWEQEPDGIKSEKEFLSYLDETVERLNNKLIVE